MCRNIIFCTLSYLLFQGSMTGWYVIFLLSADMKLIYIFYIYNADNVNLLRTLVLIRLLLLWLNECCRLRTEFSHLELQWNFCAIGETLIQVIWLNFMVRYSSKHYNPDTSGVIKPLLQDIYLQTEWLQETSRNTLFGWEKTDSSSRTEHKCLIVYMQVFTASFSKCSLTSTFKQKRRNIKVTELYISHKEESTEAEKIFIGTLKKYYCK